MAEHSDLLELNREIFASESAKLVLNIIENAEGLIKSMEGLNTSAFDALRTSTIYNALMRTNSDIQYMRVTAEILARESQMLSEENNEQTI